MELVRELELYVKGGMTTSEALATATIAPARNVKADKRTGSIAVGKEADLLLLDGDPEKNIGDLRHVDQVMSDGVLMGDQILVSSGAMMSDGSPFLPMCVRSASAADRTGSDATSTVSGVDTNPGQNELTHTPDAAHASDCDLVRESSPPLDAP